MRWKHERGRNGKRSGLTKGKKRKIWNYENEETQEEGTNGDMKEKEIERGGRVDRREKKKKRWKYERGTKKRNG